MFNCPGYIQFDIYTYFQNNMMHVLKYACIYYAYIRTIYSNSMFYCVIYENCSLLLPGDACYDDNNNIMTETRDIYKYKLPFSMK